MKILGMEVFPRRKTDEEYVEGIRKLVGRSKRAAVLHTFFALFFLGTFFCTLKFMDTAESLFAESTGPIKGGAYVGFLFGAFAGMQFILAVESMIWAAQRWHGLRTEKLMLQYHDKLTGA